MMNFDNNQPIFMQIVDLLCERILRGEITEQVPAVRELAMQMGVNPNTVQRALERMLQQEIIYSQRGRGNFLSPGASEKILQMRRDRFWAEQLPWIKKEVQLLNITPEELIQHLKQ